MEFHHSAIVSLTKLLDHGAFCSGESQSWTFEGSGSQGITIFVPLIVTILMYDLSQCWSRNDSNGFPPGEAKAVVLHSKSRGNVRDDFFNHSGHQGLPLVEQMRIEPAAVAAVLCCAEACVRSPSAVWEPIQASICPLSQLQSQGKLSSNVLQQFHKVGSTKGVA